MHRYVGIFLVKFSTHGRFPVWGDHRGNVPMAFGGFYIYSIIPSPIHMLGKGKKKTFLVGGDCNGIMERWLNHRGLLELIGPLYFIMYLGHCYHAPTVLLYVQ
jgi:hypothetical protein